MGSRHSFSFGEHFDPLNTHHGVLVVNDDDIVSSGSGFMTRPHQDMEIVTWMLSGELEHQDSVEHTGIIYPGLAQRMSAGTGIWHSEINPLPTLTAVLRYWCGRWIDLVERENRSNEGEDACMKTGS